METEITIIVVIIMDYAGYKTPPPSPTFFNSSMVAIQLIISLEGPKAWEDI